MQTILKLKWPIMIGLIVLTAALFLLAPNLTEQAEEAGSFQLSEEADSQRAATILEAEGVSGQTISLVIELDAQLNEATEQQIDDLITEIETLDDSVSSVLNPFESAELEEQLVAEDRRTVLLPVSIEGTDEEAIAIADEIRETIVPNDLTVYLTGEAIINQDVNASAQDGLKRTEIITVILIFGLLLGVFRSFVTPVIPLVAVGLSYLLSQSLVAFFIEWFGFPVSNYTQIFLVAILFGLGTDYCILLQPSRNLAKLSVHLRQTSCSLAKSCPACLFTDGGQIRFNFRKPGLDFSKAFVCIFKTFGNEAELVIDEEFIDH